MHAGDPQIRDALRERLRGKSKAHPNTRVVEEVAVLRGDCRIDVAVINGRLEGFEIKSDADTLRRLPRQVVTFGKVFDRMTIVCGERHLDKAVRSVPSWWGVEVAKSHGGRIRIVRHRPARANPAVEPLAVAQLLWRDEALAALEQAGKVKGLRNQPRRVLWEALAEALSLRELRAQVREQLRARRGWRAGHPRLAGGDW